MMPSTDRRARAMAGDTISAGCSANDLCVQRLYQVVGTLGLMREGRVIFTTDAQGEITYICLEWIAYAGQTREAAYRDGWTTPV